MKKFSRFLLLLTSVCPTFLSIQSVSAQDISPAAETQMMLRVVDLLEEYERYAGIDEDFSNYASSFRAMFVDGQAPVYNDLIGIAKGQTLTVKDYVSIMSTQSSTTRVEIKNIDKQSIFQEGNTWKIVCTFDKYVNLTSTCGIEFASDYFNASDYKLTATIVYNPEGNSCLFEKIEGTAEPIRTLSDDYRVFKSSNPRDKEVLYNGKQIEFNAMGQAFIGGNGTFVYKDPDVQLKIVEDDPQCRTWHMAYKPKPFRLKLHYDFGLGNEYSHSETNLLSDVKTSGSNFGVDLGYIFPSKSKFKIGAFVGIGMTQSNLNMSFLSNDYAYSSKADVDNDNYIRHYSNLNVTQKEKINDLTIPVYFDFGLHFSPIVSMYFDLGAKFNINLSHSLAALEGKVSEIYGIYPQYGNLYMGYNWTSSHNISYNGFAKDYTFTTENIDILLGDVSTSIDLFGAIGFRISIPKTPLAIDFGVNYLMGLTDIMTTSDGDMLSLTSMQNQDSYTAGRKAVLYNTIVGAESTEHFRSLSTAFSSVRRQALRFSIGLLLKF